MSRIAPIVMKWCEVEVTDPETGQVERVKAMVPIVRYRRIAERNYHDGGEYPLVVQEARTRAQHNGYFAALGEAFKNLPENVAARWGDAEHFRKWLLIEANWYDEKDWSFEGHNAKREAQKLGKFLRVDDDYCRVWVSEVGPNHWRVIVRKAKSQDHQHMDKETFRASSNDVLELAAQFINVKKSTLVKEAGRSA